ncbi:uncharacterized protein M421DRAFT_415537 [Didymella exigua CBS 183.55]|uniref:Microbial-type PARG catalytic domain-containing protein n=1 Tax=Didymella exigua CBS 183.55 TaxID=1150837 RepID=A0A6A5RZY3_9PLEO|nr:uncharacterized protein M421DRAFT_415537 [Didymella exigua CBS 183.55]KAF1933173.1 hypothetical protein M421DRAFT_415537 [Didymella exigua CBS 183.55]
MGRTEKSQGLAPPAIRKDIRAKQARHVINKVVPSILASNPKARSGADSSELIADPGSVSSIDIEKTINGGEGAAYVKRKGQGRRKAKDGPEVNDENTVPSKGKPKKSGKRRNDSLDKDLSVLTIDPKPLTSPPKPRTVKVITTDSLTAAKTLTINAKSAKKTPNVCILNMASPLRPGGGVLLGATSQEEFLCARTTLLPSLKESFYRLPELGGVFTHDVLVFRGSEPLGDSTGELGSAERFYVDVISAGMLRFPDLEGEDDEVKRLSKKDRGVVEGKMRAVLRIAENKGVRKLVLGAWGCGAYGNPIVDIAEAWGRVLAGKEIDAKKGPKAVESWPGLEEVVFAIMNVRMAREFAEAFGNVEVDSGPRGFDEDDEGEDDEDKVMQELQAKIEEMEKQISQVWNPDLKARLGSVLEGLKAQLKDGQGESTGSDEDGIEVGDDIDISGDQEELVESDQENSDADAEEPGSGSNDVDNGVTVKS